MTKTNTKNSHRWIASLLVCIFSLGTLTPPAHAKNFTSWEDLDTSRQETSFDGYYEVMDIGQACTAGFANHKGNDDTYLGLLGQTFISPEESSTFNLLLEQRKKTLAREILATDIHPHVFGQLEKEATQVYLNQLIYNWKLQSHIFRGNTKINIGNIGSWPEVTTAVSTAEQVLASQKNITSAIDSKKFQDHTKFFNDTIQEINQMCSNAHTIYSELMDAYNHSEKQDLSTNPNLALILGSPESYAFVDGGIKGVIRKKIQELRNVTTLEASLYKAMLSQTMFGKMYEVGTPLQRHVDEYNTVGCVERGNKLNLLPTDHKALWNIVGNSYGYLDWKYRDSLHKALDTYGEEDAETVLKEYIQSNPGSIQQALIAKPSREKAMAMCQFVHSIKTSDEIKGAIHAILAPVTMIASMMTAGATTPLTASWIAYASLILNGYFFGSTIMDISLSHDLEQRLNAGILANQIDTETAQNMIAQVQSARPFSYVNLGLSGLGTAAATLRLNQLAKIKAYSRYIDAKGGSTQSRFQSSQNPFLASEIKSNFLTKIKLAEIANRLRNGKSSNNPILDWISGKKQISAVTKLEPQGVKIVPPQKWNGWNSDEPLYTGPQPTTVTASKPYTYNQMLKESGVKAAPKTQVQIKPTITKNSPMARTEIEPDIVPTPVEPYVVPMPVLPDVTESPVASEKWEKIFAPKSDKQKRAERAIENDVDETDLEVISIIESIARGRGSLSISAREWLVKRPALQVSHYFQGGTNFFMNEDHSYINPNIKFISEVKTNGEEKLKKLLQKSQLEFKDLQKLPRLDGNSKKTKQMKDAYGNMYFFKSESFVDPQERNQLPIENIEYATYVANKKLVDRYFVSALVQINGEPVFVTLVDQTIAKFKYQDRYGNIHNLLSPEELTEIVLNDDSKSTYWNIGDERRGVIHYDMPDDIILFDLTIGNPDRFLNRNLTLPYSNQLERVFSKSDLPLEIHEYTFDPREIKIFDGDHSFSLLINSLIQNETIDAVHNTNTYYSDDWIQKHYFDGPTTHNREQWLHGLVQKNNPFMNKLKAWSPEKIRLDLNQYIPEHQINLLIENRNYLLNFVNSADVEQTNSTNQTTLKSKQTDNESSIVGQFKNASSGMGRLKPLLEKRDHIIENFIQTGRVSNEAVIKGRLKERNLQYQGQLDPDERNFNNTNDAIYKQIQEINYEMAFIFENNGFKAEIVENENFFPYLKIYITPNTGFWHTLSGYTNNETGVHPAEIYSFQFNPIFLHNLQASLTVDMANQKINFGIPTAQRIILNQLSASELHEIRHLFMQNMRNAKKQSIYHQTYTDLNGRITNDGSYGNFLSAEEIFAYGNNLKIGVEKLRNTGDIRWIQFSVNAIAPIAHGILSQTQNFAKNIEAGTYSEINTYGGPPRAVEIKLASGALLTKYFVSEAERALFSRYVDDQQLHLHEMLKAIYMDQFKLNHIAYQQAAWADELKKLLNDPEENKGEIIRISLQMYQGSKESSPKFTTDVRTPKNPAEDPHWPYVIKESKDPTLNPFVIQTIKTYDETSSKPVAMAESSGQAFQLYSNGKKVQNYNSIILDLTKGDVISFGNAEKFIVEKVFASYRDFFLVQLNDGRLLRLPEKNISKERFLNFQNIQNTIKSIGLPVLEINHIPAHGKYVMHEKIIDYFGFKNLLHYQSEKLSPENREAWGSVAPFVDDAIVSWASHTASIANIKNSELAQVIYNYSQEEKKHQWKMIVVGFETIEKKTKDNTAHMLQDHMAIFVDGTGLETRIQDAIKHEELTHSFKTSSKDNLPPSHIVWLQKNIKAFEPYYNDLIEISDRNVFLNKDYYLQQFEEILKSNPNLLSAFSNDFTSHEMDKIIKQIVDATHENQWYDILTSHGNIDHQQNFVDELHLLQEQFTQYSAMDIFSIPDFIYKARDQKAFTYQTPNFRMKIVSDGYENFILYNDEPRNDELDQINASVANLNSFSGTLDTKNTKHYKFKNEDVRYSQDLKFILIRATTDISMKPTYFLFVKNGNNNSYLPFGKVYKETIPLTMLVEFDFLLLEFLQTSISHDLPDYGLLTNTSSKAKSEIKKFISKKEDFARFYINDPVLAHEFSTVSKYHKQEIIYDVLYGHRSNDFIPNKDSCIVVIDTKYYFPSLDPNHQFIYNKNGFQITGARVIGGMKYIFITDANDKNTQANTDLVASARPLFSQITFDLAKEAAATLPAEQIKKGDDLIFPKNTLFTMTEMIASEHFFYQELNDTQRAAWDKIYKTLINSTGHEDITENEAMIAVFRGKNKSLAEAKTEFYKLGFSFDEVDAIFLRLSDPNVLIIKPFHMPQEFGNEDFLSHLPYHAEDINESRQNPIVLFRGLSSFFQNTNATQQELETFTRWIADHFTFAPFWGKNEHGVDWGYSYMQMWAKSKIATHSISPQTDLVFLVGEDQKAYVVIKIPRLNKEVLYSFSDLIGNLDTYIQQESLLPGKPCPKVKYYNLTTNASKTEIEKTSWQKDEYEDIPPSPDSMQ